MYPGGGVQFTECYDVPLIGTYDKVNNKNFIVANFFSDNGNSHMEWMIRSADYGGIICFRFNGRLLHVAVALRDEANQIMDGKLINFHRMSGGYAIGK